MLRFPNSMLRVIAYCFAMMALGCGGDARQQPTHPTTGKVMLDGKPFKGAFVALIPKDMSKFVMNERPQGTTDADGNFTLFTYATGDGAPAGDYWVGIDSPGVIEEDEGNDQVRRAKGPAIPRKYNVAQKSGLEVTIKSGTNALPPFELTTKK